MGDTLCETLAGSIQIGDYIWNEIDARSFKVTNKGRVLSEPSLLLIECEGKPSMLVWDSLTLTREVLS